MKHCIHAPSRDMRTVAAAAIAENQKVVHRVASQAVTQQDLDVFDNGHVFTKDVEHQLVHVWSRQRDPSIVATQLLTDEVLRASRAQAPSAQVKHMTRTPDCVRVAVQYVPEALVAPQSLARLNNGAK